MSTQDKQLIMDRDFFKTFDPSIKPKVTSTMEKLLTDHTRNGLHVEPILNCADDRVRTARVDQFWRMVLFDLGSWFLLSGVYPHDKAYDVASKIYARVNPTSGAAEIRSAETTEGVAGNRYTDAEIERLVEEKVAQRMVAAQEQRETAASAPQVSDEKNSLTGYDAAKLISELGIDESTATYAVGLSSNSELVEFLSRVGGWQADALMDLATGNTLEEVRDTYVVASDLEPIKGTDVGVPSDSEAVVRAATSERASAQFHLIRDDLALQQALSNGDFDAWRLFLHPDQKDYVERKTNGPFRLSGGAGTGKTVVLVHRAVRLAQDNPNARILVVSYTRNLVDMIRTQIRARDASVRINKHPGEPGIVVQTMDQVSMWVLQQQADAAAAAVTSAVAAGDAEPKNSFAAGMESVLGWGMNTKPDIRRTGFYGGNAWDEPIAQAAGDLPEKLRVAPFFESEYQEVILPGGFHELPGYARAPRMGRGTALGRNQRRAVWDVVSQYRAEGRASKSVDWDEASAVAARLLTAAGETLADHVLIDEGQDFSATRWKLARAVVAPGPDDLFIAEDSNQRIYGNRIVLGRYGINIVGRSRRLRLNYRTTEENLQLALGVLDGGEYDLDEVESGEEGFTETNPSSSGASAAPGAAPAGDRYISSRSGPAPIMIPAQNLPEEYDKVAALLKDWIADLTQDEMNTNTLGILTRTKKQRDEVVHALNERGVSTAPVDSQDIPTGMPAVMTLHRAKGTEFSRVLLFEVSAAAIPRFFAGTTYDEQASTDAALRERSLLYVGATRARDMLAVSWSKEASPYLPPQN